MRLSVRILPGIALFQAILAEIRARAFGFHAVAMLLIRSMTILKFLASRVTPHSARVLLSVQVKRRRHEPGRFDSRKNGVKVRKPRQEVGRRVR